MVDGNTTSKDFEMGIVCLEIIKGSFLGGVGSLCRDITIIANI